MKIEIRILNKEFYLKPEEFQNNAQIYGNLPSYATPGSAAMDLICTKDITIYPQERVMIPTGLAIWIASSYESAGKALVNIRANGSIFGLPESIGLAGVILPRSGLGSRGLVLSNTVGLIDEDYQGELLVSAWNNLDLPNGLSGENYFSKAIKLKAGDRFAQIMFQPVIKPQWKVVDEFSNKTERGQNGFGSTNK